MYKTRHSSNWEEIQGKRKGNMWDMWQGERKSS